jgi:hypothetical protein
MRSYFTLGRVLCRVFLASLLGVVAPSTASGQSGASIAGVVTDESGAVLPGVTIEAASPALIERTRLVVTDGTGQYKIVSLPPGLYAVTMTLEGFRTFKRVGIELTGSFVAPVNAELKVGPLTDTVNVTAASPIVDVQSSIMQKVLTKDAVDAIPSGRQAVPLAALIPGMVTGGAGAPGQGTQSTSGFATQDVGGQIGDPSAALSIHGSKPSEMRTTMNGLSIGTSIRFGDSSGAAPSLTSMQEVAVTFGGRRRVAAYGRCPAQLRPTRGRQHFQRHRVLQRREWGHAGEQL